MFSLGTLAFNKDDCGNESSSHGPSTSEQRNTVRHVIFSYSVCHRVTSVTNNEFIFAFAHCRSTYARQSRNDGTAVAA
jgi:hypothetical protein